MIFAEFMRRNREGRGLGSGLLILVALLSACDTGPGPVSDPVEDYRAPDITTVDGVRTVENHGPAEHLRVYESLPTKGLRLLFMGNRAAVPLPDGGAAWPDADGARILIFDDSLSSVDASTEREILQELRRLAQGKTCILISHRMATVREADQILVIDRGRVVQRGRHRELAAQDGIYADLCRRQEIE